MKPTWWKPLGAIGGLLLIIGIVIFVMTKGLGDIIGGCVIVAGVLSCVLFLTMKQNAEETDEAVE